MEFASKGYLVLLLLLIPYIWWYIRFRKMSEPTMRMSDTFAYQNAPRSWRIRLIHLPMVLRCLAFTAVVFVLARPQTYNAWSNKDVEGIDIMLAMDVSTSMLAKMSVQTVWKWQRMWRTTSFQTVQTTISV